MDTEAPEEGLSLSQIIHHPNIAEVLPDETLSAIEQHVKRGYEADKLSNAEWEKKIDDAMKLATQVAEKKTYPWPDAANIKYPIITVAAIQFASNAYPAIVEGRGIVKGALIGKPTPEKQARADRVGQHMSWQLSEQMEEWEGDTDSLLHVLPIVGCAYRKMYFDPMKGRNCSVLVMADKLVKDYNTELDQCQRYTEEQHFYPHEIMERVRGGVWRDVELGPAQSEHNDDQAPHKFLEHYCRYDLDGDGYPEPYIVTQHKETGKIVRMVARFDERSIKTNQRGEVVKIDPIQYHTEYFFMPAPDGGKRGWGFGLLIGPLNEAINSTLNLIIDSGHLANTGGGFIGGGMNIPSGNLRFRPGEWKRLKDTGGIIRDNIVPLNIPGPSAVLFNLLGFLVDAAQDISTAKDSITGDSNRNQPVGTTLALIERGLKVFSAIYKRVHRALKKEFKLLYRLNGIYLNPEEYFTVLDQQQAIAQQDYLMDDLDVVPVSDPTVVTDMQRMMRAEAILPFANDPGMNGAEIKRRYLEALGIDDIEGLINPNPQPGPEASEKIARLELDRLKLMVTAAEVEAKITKLMADATKSLADAEATEAGTQMQLYMSQLQEIRELVDVGRGIRELEATSNNANGPEVPGGIPAAASGVMGVR